MADTDSPVESTSSSRGCMTCIILAVAFLIAVPFGALYLSEQERIAIERLRAQWRQEWFNRVKNGDNLARVSDPLLLPMLANDPDCVANLEELFFDMVEITPNDATYVSRLTNVKSIEFYDTRGMDYVLQHSRDLPIETFYFYTATLSDATLRSLSEFPKLKKVQFEREMHPDEIAILKTLPSHIVVEIPYPAKDEPAIEDRDEQTYEPEPK